MKVVQFYTQSRAKNKSNKISNILSVYTWNYVQEKNLSVKECADALGVNIRTIYRYIVEIENFKEHFSSPF